jgi:SAM-dependent methyltransferase
MSQTRSGDYRLPSPLIRSIGNGVIKLSSVLPAVFRRRYLSRKSFYQAFGNTLNSDQQGLSSEKWNVVSQSLDFTGKRVLDIGCAEGYFCHKAVHAGASRAVGVDSRLGTLLAAHFLSKEQGVKIDFRLGVFPNLQQLGTFDVILCLSVLHHLVSTKNIWKVLSDNSYGSELQVMRGHLQSLRKLLNKGGLCIIEMPYEFDNANEHDSVDYEVFANELIGTGFSTAKRMGAWNHSERNAEKKERIVYHAYAP